MKTKPEKEKVKQRRYLATYDSVPKFQAMFDNSSIDPEGTSGKGMNYSNQIIKILQYETTFFFSEYSYVS